MNILFFSNRFFPDIGGVETVSSILAHYFVGSGHSVRLVTQSLGDSHDVKSVFPFTVLRRPASLDLLCSYRWADVVFQTNFELRQLWPLLFLRRPLVVGIQTWIRSVQLRRAPLQQLKKLALFSATHVVACSTSVKNDSFNKAIVIGNPYASKLFRILPGIKKRNSIVFLGRLVSDKGVDILLNAFAFLNDPNWSLTIIGHGPELDALVKLSQEIGIASSVHFLGSLQGEALVCELNHHKLMVIPSLWREPFGVVALEGLACGCVPLASNDGGLPDAVGPAGLLFRRGDQADLTEKLRLLTQDDALLSQLRSQSQSHLSQFNSNVICAQYMSLIESTANSRC